jgi:hypothetical protein
MASVTKEYDLGLKALLYSRFKTILGIDGLPMKQGVIQCPDEIALREFAERRAENFLDFISFYRSTATPSWSRQRSVVATRGIWLEEGVNVKAQPIDISYFATFWSKDLDKLYKVIESYIFWQHEYPKINLSYSGGAYPITPDLHFGDITDESTYHEKYETGIIFAFRMPIKIDGWALKSTTGSAFIEKIRITVYDADDVVGYETIYVEDSSQDTELAAALKLLRRHIYDINASSAVENSITIAGDWVSDFTIGETIFIQGSTGNNGVYTLASAVLFGGDTKLIFNETISDNAGDGVLYKDE